MNRYISTVQHQIVAQYISINHLNVKLIAHFQLILYVLIATNLIA